MQGKKIGIIGLAGRIGTQVARILTVGSKRMFGDMM